MPGRLVLIFAFFRSKSSQQITKKISTSKTTKIVYFTTISLCLSHNIWPTYLLVLHNVQYNDVRKSHEWSFNRRTALYFIQHSTFNILNLISQRHYLPTKRILCLINRHVRNTEQGHRARRRIPIFQSGKYLFRQPYRYITGQVQVFGSSRLLVDISRKHRQGIASRFSG